MYVVIYYMAKKTLQISGENKKLVSKLYKWKFIGKL